MGLVMAFVLYIYPGHIYYFHQIGEYNEEMLRAILRISTFISMDSSMEYAWIDTTSHLHGTLRLQFEKISRELQTKEKVTLGSALEEFVDTWNSINPSFVKSLRLLQTAMNSPKQDREGIINEVIETLIFNYTSTGKRFAEKLAHDANKLISVAVLFPVLSLMLLPLLSIFMTDLVNPAILAFIYCVLFPVVTLMMALNFSSARIQVDTVRIEDSPFYKKTPRMVYYIAIAIVVFLAIPTIVHLSTIDMSTPALANREYSLGAVVVCWLVSLGIVIATYLFTYIFTKRNEKLWNDIYSIEQDLPHLLQSISTYLTLNISMENILPEIVDDYKKFGFHNHPVVKIFSTFITKLYTTKESLEDLARNLMPKLCPSKKVTNILNQIISFNNISTKSSSRAAKMVREQTLSLYKLDDYMKTLLSDTSALINVTSTMLAPLLCASSVIMSLVIVKSLSFITSQLESMFSTLGSSGIADSLNFVDVTNIVPPTVLEVIVAIYLIEIILVLSIFATSVNIGNDRFQMLKTINSNMMGFVIYSIILLAGYIFMLVIVFQGILGATPGV